MQYNDMSKMKHLLAVVISENPEGYMMTELFKRFPTAAELLDATEQELMAIHGIGPKRARQIMSALQLSKAIPFIEQNPTVIRSPQDVFSMLRNELGFLQCEHFVCVFLNTKNHVIGKETISIGSLNAAIVHPREVMKAAIKRSSASIILAHNHPSSDPTPSTEDVETTRRLMDAGSLLGIDVLDHVIVCRDRFHSLKESGLM